MISVLVINLGHPDRPRCCIIIRAAVKTKMPVDVGAAPSLERSYSAAMWMFTPAGSLTVRAVDSPSGCTVAVFMAVSYFSVTSMIDTYGSHRLLLCLTMTLLCCQTAETSTKKKGPLGPSSNPPRERIGLGLKPVLRQSCLRLWPCSQERQSHVMGGPSRIQ